ncbi:MAG: pro-sigmaK processing inhibitor BofA family protein [Clostridiales bacterium]|nr:pro-sigmaK processing inhibitor BofA family protein [Clostridiales bacterium]
MNIVTIAYIFGVILLYVTIWLCYRPLKVLARVAFNGLLGGAAIFGINFAFGWLGVTIGINAVTSLTVGLLGVPGVALILALQHFFV